MNLPNTVIWISYFFTVWIKVIIIIELLYDINLIIESLFSFRFAAASPIFVHLLCLHVTALTYDALSLQVLDLTFHGRVIFTRFGDDSHIIWCICCEYEYELDYWTLDFNGTVLCMYAMRNDNVIAYKLLSITQELNKKVSYCKHCTSAFVVNHVKTFLTSSLITMQNLVVVSHTTVCVCT